MIGRALLHLALVLAAAPLLHGIITRVKAIVAGRKGAPLLQLYWDLAKLFRKDLVVSSTTTWVFRLGPATGFAVPILAALLVPFGPLPAPLSFTGDLFLLTGLFALARFCTVLAALDTGSSFEGMGAAREATFACLAEPTLLAVFIILARLSGSVTLNGMLGSGQSLAAQHPMAGVALALAAVCLFIVLLAENCRIPFDDPNTHLELTMIHEVMVLDHSGPDLGLILSGAAMKLMVMAMILADVVLPLPGQQTALELLVFLGALALIAVFIGLVESAMARLRLVRVPQLLVGTALLAFFALILLLR